MPQKRGHVFLCPEKIGRSLHNALIRQFFLKTCFHGFLRRVLRCSDHSENSGKLNVIKHVGLEKEKKGVSTGQNQYVDQPIFPKGGNRGRHPYTYAEVSDMQGTQELDAAFAPQSLFEP